MTQLEPSSQHKAQSMEAKKRRWQRALLSGVFTLVFYFAGWMLLALAAAIVTAVLSTLAVLSPRLLPVAAATALYDEQEEEPEEFTLQFPEPGEHGWHRSTVTPAQSRYIEEECYGGPPTTVSVFQYTVKADHVFAQLLDSREDDFDGTHFEVVNSQVLEDEIKIRKPWEWTNEHIESLKKQVVLTELEGSLRYFILSIHGCDQAIFSKEKQRIEGGFATLAREAHALGASRDGKGPYLPPDNADELTKAAILALQRGPGLKRFGITFPELVHYEHIASTLDQVMSAPRVRLRS